MSSVNQKSNFFRFILGSLFLIAGIIALGNNIGWWEIEDLFLEWWPLILILIGLINIFSSSGSNGGGLILVFVGAAFLLSTQGYFFIEDLIWPGILIMVGLFIFNGRHSNGKPKVYDASKGNHNKINDNHTFDINVVFHNGHHIIKDPELKGGQATSVFGNLVLDLRDSKPIQNIHINVSAVFGQANVLVPSDWRIKQTGANAFGSVEDFRIKSNISPDGPQVTLELNATFGRVELKN